MVLVCEYLECLGLLLVSWRKKKERNVVIHVEEEVVQVWVVRSNVRVAVSRYRCV